MLQNSKNSGHLVAYSTSGEREKEREVIDERPTNKDKISFLYFCWHYVVKCEKNPVKTQKPNRMKNK